MLVGVFVGLFKAFGRPVRSAEYADAARCVVFVECFDYRPNGHAWIVAVQQVNVDVVAAQTRQRIGHIRSDVVGRDPIAVAV